MLFFLHYLKIIKPVENLLVSLLQPVQKSIVGTADKINLFYNNKKDNIQLQRENETLQEKIRLSMVDQSLVRILEEENQFLKEQLEFEAPVDYEKLPAYIISKNGEEFINTIVINKGRKHGVQVGCPVIISEGVVIGKITKANDYNSVVLLVNDHNFQIAGTVLNEEKTIGLVRGEYGLGVKMELIPQIENVNEGDLIITSGTEENIPRGLVIGTVGSLYGSPEDIFKEAVINLPYNYEKLIIVTVLINKSNAVDNN